MENNCNVININNANNYNMDNRQIMNNTNNNNNQNCQMINNYSFPMSIGNNFQMNLNNNGNINFNNINNLQNMMNKPNINQNNMNQQKMNNMNIIGNMPNINQNNMNPPIMNNMNNMTNINQKNMNQQNMNNMNSMGNMPNINLNNMNTPIINNMNSMTNINQNNMNQQNMNYMINMGNMNTNINQNNIIQQNMYSMIKSNNANQQYFNNMNNMEIYNQNFIYNNNNNIGNNNNLPNYNQNICIPISNNNTCSCQCFDNPLIHTMHFIPSFDFGCLNKGTETQIKDFCQYCNNNQNNANNINNILYCQLIKLNLNIIYYDENLKNEENSLYCAFFKMGNTGTFYGCHNFQLLKYVLKKIKDTNKDFAIISSGKSANLVFNYCSVIPEIKYYFIYCSAVENYLNLKQDYHKLIDVYNNFNLLIGGLISLPKIQTPPLNSSSLIFFENYNRIYIKLHYEIIKKYYLYKLLKSKNNDEMKFHQIIENKFPYYRYLAEELLRHDKNEIKEFFKKKTGENEDLIESVFNASHNIRNYIKFYTYEGFYYKYINLFLRQGDLETFKILSSHISKFIYHLYEYRKHIIQEQDTSVLFRNMYISKEEFEIYENNINRVICYPSFTSTSILENAFNPINNFNNAQYVKLVIQQNNSKSVVSIGKISQNPDEKEYLFIPFSFFRIIRVRKSENENEPHVIYLMALNSEESIEEMIIDFMENVTDNLDPEGLDMLQLDEYNTKIIINNELKCCNI